MDEVPLTFDDLSNKALDIKGAKSITIKTSGHKKPHNTVVLACCPGATKLPSLIIFKSKTMLSNKIPRGFFIHIHAEG
jgi:hypothetical protein